MEYYLQALLTLLTPSHFIVLLISSFFGIIFGAIPGLAGGLGVSLLLPLTFGMEPTIGFTMLLGMWIGGVSGGFISAVLIGIPGAPSSIATCFDGYPMSQNGETVKALTIGIVASFMGTILSIIIATLLSPMIADFALSLGPWEYFSLCFAAVTTVVCLAKEGTSLFRGLMGAFVGLFLSTVGMSVMDASYRFTFGNYNLFNGLDLVAMMLGVFALRQVIVDFAKGNQQMPDVKIGKISAGGLDFLKTLDFIKNIGIIIRSFIIGLWIGFLPGMGAGLSNLVAYAQAKASSKEPEKFGKGHPSGVWASEVANNAAVGGAITPMIALGIPGDSVTALLLGGLMIHGLQPGPLLMTSNPQIAYFIFAAALVATLVVLAQQLLGIRWFAYLLRVPYHFLYGVILIVCFVGAFTVTNTMFNVGMLLVFGIIGILFEALKIPLSPFVLAFILGPQLETYFRKGMSYSVNGAAEFFTRPISLLFLIVGVMVIVWPEIKPMIFKQKTQNYC